MNRGLLISCLSATAVVGMVVIATVSLSGASSHPAISIRGAGTSANPNASWEGLPTLPGTERYTSHVSLESVGERVFAASVSKYGKNSTLRVWELEGGEWRGPIGRRSWQVNADVPSSLVAALGTVCVGVDSPSNSINVYCLRGSTWKRAGAQIAKPSKHRYALDYLSVEKRPFVITSSSSTGKSLPGGVGMIQRFSSNVTGLNTRRWTAFEGGDLETGAGGSQRPTGTAINGLPCIAYNALPAPTSQERTEVRFKCPEDGKWREIAPPISNPNAAHIDIDGFASIGSSIFAGVDEFVKDQSTGDVQVSWSVYAFDGSSWSKSNLARVDDRWQSQGTLYGVGRELWAFQFDQQSASTGYRARFEIRALNPATGETRKVGRTLLPPTTIYGPPAYDIASTKNFAYVAFSKPRASRQSQPIALKRIPIH